MHNFDANSTNMTEVRTNKQTNERMNEHTNGQTDERKDENYTRRHKCRGYNNVGHMTILLQRPYMVKKKLKRNQ